jgi:hypothetical protein
MCEYEAALALVGLALAAQLLLRGRVVADHVRLQLQQQLLQRRPRPLGAAQLGLLVLALLGLGGERRARAQQGARVLAPAAAPMRRASCIESCRRHAASGSSAAARALERHREQAR